MMIKVIISIECFFVSIFDWFLVYFTGADFDIHIEHEADRYTMPSKKGMTRANQMTEIQKIITSTGWLDKSPNGLSKVDLNEVEPEEELSPTQWKAAVKAKRQEML